MTVYITGDTHGDLDIDKLSLDTLASEGIEPEPEDFLIILGDVGAVFWTKPWELPDLDPRDEEVVDILQEAPWTVLFIDGNHDNTDALADADEEIWHGGLVHRIAPRVLHLARGQVFEIEDATFFTMGGAASIDRASRTEGETWWASEVPEEYELDEGKRNLSKHGNKVDFVLTHTAPTSMLDEMVYEDVRPDELTDYLQEIADTTDFEEWFFGHFHDDTVCSNPRFRCVYNEIIELDL